MNPFALLFLPILDVVRVVTHQNDKTRICSTYFPKTFFIEEQPRASIWKVHFDKIRSIRINPYIPPNFCEPHPNDKITIDEEYYEYVNSIYHMNIIGETPNKFNMDFADGDFESVNQESFVDTSKNESNNDDVDVILATVIYIKELMAHIDRMEYFITNHVEVVINILTKHELLELDPSTLLSSDSLFKYENVGS